MKIQAHLSLALLVLGVAALLASCTQEEMPQGPVQVGTGSGSSSGSSPGSGSSSSGIATRPDAGAPSSGSCVQALGSENIPARIDVMSTSAAMAAAPPKMIQVSDIVQLIGTHCATAGCHQPGAAQGGFSVSTPAELAASPTPLYAGGTTYVSRGEWALAHITGTAVEPNDPSHPCTSPDTCYAMPPPSTLEYQSHAIDPLRDDLQAWVQAGRPLTSFAVQSATPPSSDADAGFAPSSYLMSPTVANGLTNIGSCIPDATIVATNVAGMMDLDARFAAMKPLANPDRTATASQIIGLPESLSDTDLTTFDSGVLARTGVIAFVPQYPLWSDGSAKLRYVRVPYGTSIQFDKDKQEFVIPPNTRFYKTFLKRIIDTDGNPSYRKIETRLILARPDTVDSSGVTHVTALFASYKWNPDETQATIQQLPTNDLGSTDGSGFEDDVSAYETNVFTHETRHYAIPGSARCWQCHQGSPTQDFVLGFRPVQLYHRPVGEGGVVEPSGPDEMMQLQRLIDYGVITGMSSPADVTLLEDTEGDRKPRNTYELTAQGYMLGNCAHCHNPRGFPSVQFPVLKDVLSFLPGPQGGADGGIFQFPLEKFSPRIVRGQTGSVPLPYVTPSLLDNPSWPEGISDSVLNPNQGDNGGGLPTAAHPLLWDPKWLVDNSQGAAEAFAYAPWRSLIYRNVDTPFTYVDDFTIYPHMPLHTAGYDYRAKQIFADWMVSIPAVRKRPDIPEYRLPYDLNAAAAGEPWPDHGDTSPQPYTELVPGSPGYDAAVLAAQQRLAIMHSGARPSEKPPARDTDYQGRYAYSPDTSDIVDLTVNPTGNPPTFVPSSIDRSPNPFIGVPVHAHWVSVDLTPPLGQWDPKRGDWKSVLVDRTEYYSDAGVGDSGATDLITAPEADKADIQHVIDILLGPRGGPGGADAGLRPGDGVPTFALAARPMGFWKEKPQCDWSKGMLASVKTLGQLRQTDHRAWMDDFDSTYDDRHVYSSSPGAFIFNQICANCHGTQADSKGRLSDNIATVTGGNAVVADFRDGLFGPRSAAGSFRNDVFGAAAQASQLTVDDLASRYMAFMALGGTEKVIPSPFLAIVGHTPVFGESRARGLPPPTQANMLTNVRQLCLATLWDAPYDFQGTPNRSYLKPNADQMGYFYYPRSGYLEYDNGDAEMWLDLCNLNNPAPVVVLKRSGDGGGSIAPDQIVTSSAIDFLPHGVTGLLTEPASVARVDFLAAAQKASVAPSAGDENGAIEGALSDGNRHPWCGNGLSGPNSRLSGKAGGVRVDACLGGLDCSDQDVCTGDYGTSGDPNCVYPPECPAGMPSPDPAVSEDWAIRGAINAAFSVFAYLDAVTKGKISFEPTYDQCDLAQQMGQTTTATADSASPSP